MVADCRLRVTDCGLLIADWGSRAELQFGLLVLASFALTFAMREALYGLDLIASELIPDYPPRALAVAMENLMLEEPRWWAPYYPGDAAQQRVWRHYSYSDRIRYYWPRPQAEAAVRRLSEALLGVEIPPPLLQQFLPQQSFDEPATRRTAESMILASVDIVLNQYASACDSVN